MKNNNLKTYIEKLEDLYFDLGLDAEDLSARDNEIAEKAMQNIKNAYELLKSVGKVKI